MNHMVLGPTFVSLTIVPVARSVSESCEGPTESESDRKGRNPEMTRLVRRSGAVSGSTAFFSFVQTSRQRMRK